MREIKEIGSEYHRSPFPQGSGFCFPLKGTLSFSGRTSLEIVLKKIPKVKKVLLPSYCCDSMIEPFRRAGKEIKFFDVNYQNGIKIKIETSADALLWCNYFGFKNEIPDFDGVVIEDITHSLLSKKSYHEQSTYLIASVRKWWPIYCGGYCSVEDETLLDPPSSFIKKKANAMEEKTAYLKEKDEIKKRKYLSEFRESNLWLEKNYSGLGIDFFSREYIKSVNVEKERRIRKRNAHVLYEGLLNKVEFLFEEEKMDCPLFVPIILKKNRDKIRQKMIEQKIFCPVHWPKPKEQCDSNLYDIEMSLICDQRYSERDMERIISVFKKAL